MSITRRFASIITPLIVAASFTACSDGAIGDGDDLGSPEDMSPVTNLDLKEGRAAEEPEDTENDVEDRTAEGTISGLWVYDHVQAFSNGICRYVSACNASTYNGHHPSASRAVDVMINGGGVWPTATQTQKGENIANFALKNMRKYGIWYVIWKQRINYGDGNGWQWMADRGSITQNHYDHVHVSFWTTSNLGLAVNWSGSGSTTVTCNSYTLGRSVPQGTCVQSKVDYLWYQCSSSSTWLYAPNVRTGGAGPVGACTAKYAR